jgi:hypothetical protein
MKKYIAAVALAVCLSLAPMQAQAGEDWTTTEKTLFVTYSALNVVDMLQTRFIFDSDLFYEANPILNKLGKNGSMVFMAGGNVALYFAIDYLPSKYRTWALGIMNVTKLGVVGHNAYLGVGFKF